MANGDEITRNQRTVHVKLVDAVVATTNGAWVDTLDYENGSIHVDIGTTGTVQIMGRNDPTRPADGTDGVQIGADITADSLYCIDRLPRWLKAKVTAVSGALSVYALFRKQAM